MFKYQGSNCRLDIRRIFFSQRVVNTGNSLSDSLKGVGGIVLAEVWSMMPGRVMKETTPQQISEEEISHNVKPSNAGGQVAPHTYERPLQKGVGGLWDKD